MSSARASYGWLFVITIATIAGLTFGLFDQLRYDSSVFVALLLAVAIPHVAAVQVRELRSSGKGRRRSARDYVLSVYMRVLGVGLLLWLVPLVLFLARGLWTPHCDLAFGVLWYLAIPAVTCAYTAALGSFFALANSRVSWALVSSYAFIALTFAIAIRHLVAEPPLYAVNGVVGYIPGPIYDEIVTMSPPLIWGRVGTVVWTVLFLSLAAAMCSVRRYELDVMQLIEFDGSLSGLLTKGVVVASVAGLIVLHVYRQELGTSRDAASIQAALGGRIESEHFVLYYDRASIPPERARAIVDDHEFRLWEVLRTLDRDVTATSEKITSYVYGSPDRKKSLMGARHTSFADPFARAMHLNDAPLPHPVLKHELVHVVSKDFAGWLGFNPRIGIHEGLAVAVDWEQERLTPDQWAAIMQREELLPPLSQLASLAFWAKPASRAYLSTGSFMRYLLDRSDAPAVLAFFGDNDYTEHFGATPDSLERAWHEYLATVPVDSTEHAYGLSRVRRRAIFDRVCPRKIAKLTSDGWALYMARDYGGALDHFDDALARAPHDDGAALGRLRSLIGIDAHEEADRWARDLLERDSSSARTRDEARVAIGNDAWRRGDLDDARVWFEEIIAANTTETFVRGAQLKLEVLDHDGYRQVFTGNLGESEEIAALTRLASNGPVMSVASYLLGRRFFAEDSFDGAATHLERAAQSWLPSRELQAEASRLLGIARFRLADVDAAESAFTRFADASHGAARTRADSWIARCRWLRARTAPDSSEVATADIAAGDAS